LSRAKRVGHTNGRNFKRKRVEQTKVREPHKKE